MNIRSQATFLLVLNYYLSAVSMFFVDRGWFESTFNMGPLVPEIFIKRAKSIAEKRLTLDVIFFRANAIGLCDQL
jgi:hypothetical protein